MAWEDGGGEDLLSRPVRAEIIWSKSASIANAQERCPYGLEAAVPPQQDEMLGGTMLIPDNEPRALRQINEA
jgi:hypothetical protein